MPVGSHPSIESFLFVFGISFHHKNSTIWFIVLDMDRPSIPLHQFLHYEHPETSGFVISVGETFLEDNILELIRYALPEISEHYLASFFGTDDIYHHLLRLTMMDGIVDNVVDYC